MEGHTNNLEDGLFNRATVPLPPLDNKKFRTTLSRPKLLPHTSMINTKLSSKINSGSEIGADDSNLQSRLEEQSELILILKRRSDEAIQSTNRVTEANVRLQKQCHQLQQELEAEAEKYSVLDSRFANLASNHQELIKFKDEYKTRNMQLSEENSRLRDENNRLFSSTVEEKNKIIIRLESVAEELTNERDKLSKQLSLAGDAKLQLELQISRERDLAATKLKKLQDSLTDVTEERDDIRTQMIKADSDSKDKINLLQEQVKDLLEVKESNDKILQEKDDQIVKLEQKIESSERKQKEMQQKLEKELAAADSNNQIKILRQNLFALQKRNESTVKEYEAYKSHSQSLLQKEKELNARLRHLVD